MRDQIPIVWPLAPTFTPTPNARIQSLAAEALEKATPASWAVALTEILRIVQEPAPIYPAAGQ